MLDRLRDTASSWADAATTMIDDMRERITGEPAEPPPSFFDDIEPLTQEGDPELYHAVEALKRDIAEDYRHSRDALAEVYLLNLTEAQEQALYLQSGMPHFGIYMLTVNSEEFPLPGGEVTEGEYEIILVSRNILEDFGVQTAIDVIAHEYGHDMLNHYKPENMQLSRVNECEADHFAAHYTGGASLKAFFERAQLAEEHHPLRIMLTEEQKAQLEEVGKRYATHPTHEERVAALSDHTILDTVVTSL